MHTTTYPNRYYSVTSGASSTAYIYAGDQLVAFVETGTTTSATSYVHPDHLGSTHVTTNASGTVVQVLDYYPFGAGRINNSTGGVDEKRKFVGMERDDSTGLDYAMARYYDNVRGQFVSQDPVFWELGLTSEGKAALLDPQLQNSYSWARNNPITLKDPNGRFVPQVVALGFLYGGLANVAFQGYAGNINSFGDFANAFAIGGAVTAASIVNPLFGGGVAASLSLAESAGRNGNITWESGVNAAAQGGVTWATGGFLRGLPGVPGPQASKIFGGNYFSGAHGTRYAQEAAFGFGTDVYHHNVQQISQSLLNFYAPQVSGSRSSGGGGNINQLSQSVINYANNPGANLSDPGFVAGIRAINEYNNALTTPSKK